jgi:hypothetical protein
MSAPERIYLQWFEGDAAAYIPEGVTWCADRIEDYDVEYVRADKAAAERDHWKANHDNQVSRARFLIERGDIPIERVRAYEEMQTLRAILQDILAAGPIKEDEYPKLLARARAALGGGA